MRVLDLFSGIGGFSLGLERTGMETVAFCEFDKKAQLVLKKHWPDVPIFDDVRELTYERLEECGLVGNSKLYGQSTSKKPRGIKKTGNEITVRKDKAGKFEGTSRPKDGKCVDSSQSAETEGQSIDLICGGFPCQPFSVAGKQRGEEDDRHLWPEYFRLIQQIRPRWVIGENVAGLINLGLDEVLSDLESAGYTVQTFNIPACSVNAPHRRDRLWIVAHSNNGQRNGTELEIRTGGDAPDNGGKVMGHSEIKLGNGSHPFAETSRKGVRQPRGTGECDTLADSKRERLQGRENGRRYGEKQPRPGESGGAIKDQWITEPNVGRVANGIPNRVDRLKQLGNAVVPQVVEVLGRAIMEIEAMTYCNKNEY